MPEADHDAVPLWRYVRAAKFHARDASATGTSDAEGRRGNAGVPERSSRIGTPRAIARANAQGFKRLANAITRDAIGIPLTRKQRAETKPSCQSSIRQRSTKIRIARPFSGSGHRAICLRDAKQCGLLADSFCRR